MEVMNEAVAQRINPAGAAMSSVYSYLKGSANPAFSATFLPSEFFATYISCANWMSMTDAVRRRTMAGYLETMFPQPIRASSGNFHWSVAGTAPGPMQPPGTILNQPPVQTSLGPNDPSVSHAVSAANAYCAAQNPPTQYAPHGTPAPHVIAPTPHRAVGPAGQVTAPSTSFLSLSNPVTTGLLGLAVGIGVGYLAARR